MRKIDAYLADYAAYHSTRGNVVCHFLGIPLIVFGLLSMLGAVPIAHMGGLGLLTLAEVLLVASILYDASLDLPLAAAWLVSGAALDALARWVGDWRVGLLAFVVGWVFQGIGHARYEKKAPAFLKNFVHLLVGPLFLLNELLHVRKIQERTA